MGSSQITSIYGAIAALTPTPGGTVAVEAYGSVTSTLHADMLPRRKIQAFANDTEAGFAFVALGTTINVEWTIQDRFLYRIANQGKGWEDFADELIAYCASYINTLRTNRALGLSQVHVTGARFVPFVTEWRDGQMVAGVDAILTVEEVIT